MFFIMILFMLIYFCRSEYSQHPVLRNPQSTLFEGLTVLVYPRSKCFPLHQDRVSQPYKTRAFCCYIRTVAHNESWHLWIILCQRFENFFGVWNDSLDRGSGRPEISKYTLQQNTHKNAYTSMPRMGFEPRSHSIERPRLVRFPTFLFPVYFSLFVYLFPFFVFIFSYRSVFWVVCTRTFSGFKCNY
jgi:hypothetical protein